MTASSSTPWNLVADIGGTNARFGVYTRGGGELRLVQNYPVGENADFIPVLQRFIGEVAEAGGWLGFPVAACLAVPGPVDASVVRFVNSPWIIDRAQTARLLQLNDIELVNDFAAVGYAVPDLAVEDWHQLGGGEAVDDAPIAVLGPGTGLGVCSLAPVNGDFCVITGEGGHVDFGPSNDSELVVWKYLDQRFEHVSLERLLSGSGIVNIYQALSRHRGTAASLQRADEISAAALEDRCEIAQASMHLFCNLLGSAAGNLALTLGARGGVYLAGGIAPRLIDLFESSQCRERFEAKGRFRQYLETIPLRIIRKSNLGLHGAAKKLSLTGY